MKLSISKSKNAESFYITQSYIDDSGKSTSKIVRKLGTLNSLCSELNTDRDGVVAWAKEQVRLETEKYKSEKEAKKAKYTSCRRWLGRMIKGCIELQ